MNPNRCTPIALLVCLATLLSTLLSMSSRAQAPDRDPTRLFPHEAEVNASTPGLVRLPLRPDVLSRARPDLSDLRLFDAEGLELPFFVDRGRDEWPSDVSPRIPLALLDVRERDAQRLDPTSFQELRVAAPPSPPEGALWSLELDAPAERFVRQVVVHWEDASGVVELARGSVFRIPRPARAQLRIALPGLPEATPDARLVIAIHGEGPLLSPTVHLIGERVVAPPDVLTVPLEIVSTTREDTRTVVELARPVGLVPERLRVSTSERSFVRAVEIVDLRQGRDPASLGRGELFRLTEVDEEELAISLGRASGDRLRVTIEDGDTASLHELSFAAEIRRPALVFEHRPGTRVVFGGGRARPRQHDLEALAGTSLGEGVLEGPIAEATLGEVRDNPRFDGRPALGFARPGVAVELAPFAALADLTVRDAAEGASRFEPSAALLARARGDLADLRIVDAEGNAWPYVLSPAETRFEHALTVAAPTTTARKSVHVLAIEPGPLPVVRVSIDPDEPYVSRAFVLFGVDVRGERRRLASGTLSRGPEDDAPIVIEVEARVQSPSASRPRPFSRSRFRAVEDPSFGAGDRARFVSLELEIEDGDDRPLTLRDARAEIATRTVFLAAPDGSYRVVVGNAEAEAPRYELEDAIDLVLAVRSVVAELGEVRDNPAHEPPAFWKRVDVTTFLVWGVLIFAVLVLGVVTLRLVRSGAEPESGGAPATGTAASAEPKAEPRGETPATDSAPSADAVSSPEVSSPAATSSSTDVESAASTSSSDPPA
ncbi:MAG: DUF3999 domain-containing protein [Myxococcota bacterium]|jgi:hypothetical protein|nr:DUF3999 domain-containing protein [Myxococcota bacterium]